VTTESEEKFNIEDQHILAAQRRKLTELTDQNLMLEAAFNQALAQTKSQQTVIDQLAAKIRELTDDKVIDGDDADDGPIARTRR
jgi:hypothetical protein